MNLLATIRAELEKDGATLTITFDNGQREALFLAFGLPPGRVAEELERVADRVRIDVDEVTS